MALEAHEQRTDGVNYEPRLISAPTPADAGGESVSSAPMHFAVSAEIGGSPVELVAPMGTCGSGCRKTLFTSLGEEPGMGAEIAIVRFAKFGVQELPDGTPMTWLVVMEDGDTLSGPLRLPSEDVVGGYPGRLSLGGRMVITVQIGDEAPLRLRSRKEPVLSGAVAGWPPYGMHLELENGPVEYFAEDALDDERVEPIVRVTGNSVLLGTMPHPILSRAPEIREAKRTDQGGLRLSWTDTAAEIATDPPITAYHVYRNLEPGDIGSWELAARVPAAQTSWEDPGHRRGQAAEYLLVHSARCPLEYDLEGLLGEPISVSADT